MPKPRFPTRSSGSCELRPQIVESGGADEANRFADHLATLQRLQRERDADGLQDEAAKGLELVDELERVLA